MGMNRKTMQRALRRMQDQGSFKVAYIQDNEQKKKQKRFEEIKLIRETTTQNVCWCVSIVLNQHFGYGKRRIDKMAHCIEELEIIYAVDIKQTKGEEANRRLRNLAAEICCPEFATIKKPADLKAMSAAERREEIENNMHRDQCKELGWWFCALGVRQAFHFGQQRMEELRLRSIALYNQFVTEAIEDGEEVAYEHMRRCVEQMLQEDVRMLEEGNTDDEEVKRRTDAWIARCNAAAAQRAATATRNTARKVWLQNKAPEINVLSSSYLQKLEDETEEMQRRLMKINTGRIPLPIPPKEGE